MQLLPSGKDFALAGCLLIVIGAIAGVVLLKLVSWLFAHLTWIP